MIQQQKFNNHSVFWHGARRLCKTIGWVLSIGLSFPLLAQGPSGDSSSKDRLAPLKARLAEQYSDVRHLSIEEYLELHPHALLVDVRAAEEYEVSRIPGAVHIEDRAKLLNFARQHADQQLILYCSVGARSAEAARFLQTQGQADAVSEGQQIGEVANLAGSIFEWANEKRPLENDAGPTEEVHSFNAWWGWRYLD